MKTASVICVLLLSTTMPLEKKQNWVVTKSKEGITTYVSANESSNAPTKSEMIVDAPLNKTISTITNIDNYTKWVPYCKKSYCIEQVSDSVKYCYQLISAPMVKDRDVVSRMTVQKINENCYQIIITSFPNYIAKKNNTIRIEQLNTVYLVKAISKTKTFISQENKVSLGGSIPDFMVSWANKSQPFETFKNLRETIVNQ